MRGLALAAAAGVASGQTPPDEPPPVGQPCVVSGGKCMCGSTDLSEFRGREIRTPEMGELRATGRVADRLGARGVDIVASWLRVTPAP